MANGETWQKINGNHTAKWLGIGFTFLTAVGGVFYTAVKVQALAETNSKAISELKTVDLPVIRSIVVPRNELMVQFQSIQSDIQEIRGQNREILRELRRARTGN